MPFLHYIKKILHKGVKISTSTLLLLCVSCNSEESSVPNRRVYLEIDLRTDIELTIEGNAKTFTKGTTYDSELGYAGILVVRGLNDYDLYGNAFERFYAYDLCCAYEVDPNVRVGIKEGEVNVYAECPSCGTKYNIIYGNGNVEKGPGTRPLRRYETFHNDSYIVRVIN